MSQAKKSQMLGMPIQTASNRLRKSLLWSLIQETGKDICYHCGGKILSEEDLSIEHKTPWMYSGREQELYFDLSNISFSHINCNKGAARKTFAKCGTRSAYGRGCRCELCTAANRDHVRRQRSKCL